MSNEKLKHIYRRLTDAERARHSEIREAALKDISPKRTTSRKLSLSGIPTYQVGDRVRVRISFEDSLGTIVEDRGFLGSGGRHLFRVKVDFDPPNVVFVEMPEEELSAV